MSIQTCPKCGACFIDGTLRWSNNGKEGDPRDLAGLVCQYINKDNCINPMREVVGGDTWQERQRISQLYF